MKRPDELLAAYADGGLTADEAAEVEALLARSPEARAELEAIRRLLDEARRAEDAAEPDWDQMAREIHRACDTAPSARRAWLRWPRPALALGGLAAAAAAAVLFIALRGERDGGGAQRAASAPPVAPAPAAASEGDDDALPELREPAIDELDDDEVAALDEELAADDLGDDGFIADLLAPAGDDDGDDEVPDVFDDHPLTADELADELPPDAIEKLDRFLAEVSAG
jgi:hypothetical protein